MSRFELLVELNGVRRWLDTYESEPISLTYNVADIINIDKINSSYSKTIKLPETKNNREIFGDISDLGVLSTFNPNKKTRAWILVDTTMVFEGHLQLRKVILDADVDKREYEIVIYADNDNFFKQIGENFLTDLDFSELNHDWTANNIRQSWTASWETGYFYPLIDYGYNWNLGSINGWTTAYNTEVKTTQMYPSTNVKYIWDKIFNIAGYSYQSNFINSEVFESLYIPFNKKEILRVVNSISNKFTIGMLNPSTFSTTATYSIPQDYISVSGGSNVANNIPINFGKFKLPFNNENAPNGDPDGLYNTTTYEYTAPSNFVSGRFVCDFDITWAFTSNLNTNIPGSINPLTSICFRRSKNPATGLDVVGGVVIPVNGATIPLRFTQSQIPGLQYDLIQPLVPGTSPAPSLNSVIIFPGPRRVYGQISTDILDDSTPSRKKLYPGEKVWVELNYGAMNSQIRKQFGNANLLPPTATYGSTVYNTSLPAGTQLGTFSAANKFFNILTTNVLVNEPIDYNAVIPENFKQKDFITSIIKMFNLIVEPSKVNQNTLIIEPRDDYYASGRIKDWTRKLNINEPIEEQILAETQNRQTNFKYKDDKDIYNEDYKNNRGGLAYGEYQYFINNDFITGEKKVEIQFSPTPLIPLESSVQLVIPVIAKVNNNILSKTEHNPRILTRFNSSTKSTWVYSDYQFHSGGVYNSYTKLTTDGFTNLIHPNYQVGDWISINQSDGGLLKPSLEGQFKILEIVDTKTIVINIPFSSVGSGTPISGTITPLNGLLPTASDNDTWQFEGVRYKAYPYLGHFDNPQQPSYDLNWGQTTGLYYPEDTVTNNNLFTSYWENTINEITDRDSRIITASFYLNPFDISDFRFNDNIFINNQYYKVNKIINYDPTKEALVKVELIKSIYITIPRPFVRTTIQRPENSIAVLSTGTGKPFTTTGVISAGKDIVLGRPLGKPGNLSGALKTNTTNLTTTSDIVISGRDNQIYGNNVIISGNSNIVSSDKNFIQGDNNIIEGGVEGAFVIASNLKITNSGFYIEGPVISVANAVRAGRNEVLGAFSFISTNYISASRNVVRNLGSSVPIFLLSGGRYNIS